MYNDFFELSDRPFSLTPNTLYYQPLPSHQEALNMVLVALSSGDGFIKITGEVGLGKTMLCRAVLNELDEQGHITIYLPNSYLNPDEFRSSVARELGIYNEGKGAIELLEVITDLLIHYAQLGKSVVLIVDEAQAMPRETIEALRLLTNLETESRKLFQVVLIGQPELDVRLEEHGLRQLKQRITFSCALVPLTHPELAGYVSARLRAAGYNGPELFTAPAIKALYFASGGVPRVINILAHKAMLSAYGKGVYEVNRLHVKAAIEDSDALIRDVRVDPRSWRFVVAGLFAGLALSGAGVATYIWMHL